MSKKPHVVKFRFWDPEERFMYSWEQVCDRWLLLQLNQSELHVPLQFTGLLADGKKEIYQGDIVEITFQNNFKQIGVMDWNSELARFSWYAYGEGGYGLSSDLEEAKNRKILGNIYENPGLMS